MGAPAYLSSRTPEEWADLYRKAYPHATVLVNGREIRIRFSAELEQVIEWKPELEPR